MNKLPRLSLIIPARNDQYMGDFKWRFETMLNYLAANLQSLGRLEDVEVVVTDWGSEVPLYAALSLNPAAKRIVRFVIVPPDLARRVQKDSEFPIVIAQNVAIRRSRAEYIAQTDSDILLPIEFLERLLAILDGRFPIEARLDGTLMFCRRHHVPWGCVRRRSTLAEIDWLVHRLKYFLREQGPGCGVPFSATGFWLMHRSIWDECRGYDERLIHWGWMEIDLGLRVTQKHPWVDLHDLGMTLFHLEHYHPVTRRTPLRRLNPIKRDNPYCINDDRWGLNQDVLPEFSYPVDLGRVDRSTVGRRQRVTLNHRVLSSAAQVLLAAALRGAKARVIGRVRKHLPWLASSLSTWYRRASGVAWSMVPGQPVRPQPENSAGGVDGVKTEEK